MNKKIKKIIKNKIFMYTLTCIRIYIKKYNSDGDQENILGIVLPIYYSNTQHKNNDVKCNHNKHKTVIYVNFVKNFLQLLRRYIYYYYYLMSAGMQNNKYCKNS